MRNERSSGVKLLQEALHDLAAALLVRDFQIKMIPSDQFAVSDKKYLRDGILSVGRKRNHILIFSASRSDLLSLTHLLHGPDQIPQGSCLLKIQRIGSLLHFCLQFLKHIFRLPVQKSNRIIDLLPIFLL